MPPPALAAWRIPPIPHPGAEHHICNRNCYDFHMRLALKKHPDSHCGAVTAIQVGVTRPRAGALALHYFVSGNLHDLRIPPLAPPTRTDELWRHTCFEAFVQMPPSSAYHEFNFAPSTQWAAYCFGGYRSGMAVADRSHAPHIETISNDAGYELKVSLALSGLPGLTDDAPWRLGLSAVIEEAN